MGPFLPEMVAATLNIMAVLFIVAVGCGVLAVVVLFLIDVCQTRHAIRRNYPVIGRLRGLFEHLGTFFRQYFFAMDREELPFNRAQRSWVYRAAKNEDNTAAFGSTRDLRPVGTPLFVACPFPTLAADAVTPAPITIGPGCPRPYTTASLFNISGMSYGAISRVAVKALSRGAGLAGCWLNTGEGGLSEFHLEGGCDIVFQIGTAKYGCRDEAGNLSDARLGEIAARDEVRMFEIKLSQGAKPGKGGVLPGAKVNAEIAAIRHIPEGRDSISPNRFPEIDSVADLLDMIARVRRVTGKPTGFKTVISESEWIAELCREIHARGIAHAPDFITVDSAEGGSGAAPMSLMDTMGLPIWESLPMVADELIRFDLKDRIRVIASGKLITATEVAWAICAGADFVTSARGFMFSLGCIQALQCNRNTCPTGVTTHDRRRQRGLVPREKQFRVAHYARNVVKEVGVIAHACGVPEARRLRRHHVRLQTDGGRSVPMHRIWPEPERGAALRSAATAAE